MQVEKDLQKQTILTTVLYTVVEPEPNTSAEGVKQVQKMHTM